MQEYIIKKCQRCRRQLRIPTNIGGMLMRCPDCNHEFHTDFKLVAKTRKGQDAEQESKPEIPTRRPKCTFKITV